MQTTTAAAESPPVRSSGGAAVAKHSAVVTFAGLLGKPLALVRDILITRTFGASAATDALFLALSLPIGIAAVVAGGGLRVAFQPEFARRYHASPRTAWRFALAVLVAITALTAFITAGLFTGAAPLSRVLTSPERTEELRALIRLLAPMLLLFGLQDILTGILHVRLRFFWPAMEAVLRNSAIILMVLLFASAGIHAVAYGHLLGTAMLVVACAISAWGAGLRIVLPQREERAALGKLVLAAAPATLGGAIFPICAFLDRTMASWLQAGSVSALAYADSIWQLGLVVAGPVSVVALPVLTGMVARGESDQLGATVSRTVRATVFVTAPLSALLVALAEPTVRLLFMRGRFEAAEAELTAQAVAFFALGLPFVAAQGVSMRALQAMGRFGETAKLAVIILVLHVGQNLVLMQVLGHRGIALGYGLSAAQLLWLIDRRLLLPSPGRWGFVTRLAAASVACYLGSSIAASLVPPGEIQMLDAVMQLVVGGAAGLVAFVLTSLLLWGRDGRTALSLLRNQR